MIMATVVDTVISPPWFRAEFVANQEFQACRFNRMRRGNTPFVNEWFDLEPERQKWSVKTNLDATSLYANYWQWSNPYGGGYRIVFMPKYVKRFAYGDGDWFSEFLREFRSQIRDA